MDDTRTNLFTAHLGRDAWGNRLFAEVEVTVRGRDSVTVEHEPIAAGYRGLSFTGWTIRRHTVATWDTAGQLYGMTKGMTQIADGWTAADISSLRKLAKAWHLNDMKAACAHQDEKAAREAFGAVPAFISVEKSPEHPHGLRRPDVSDYPTAAVCPATGRIYGHGWLVKPIPQEVWDELHRLACLPTGTIVK